MKNNPDLMGCFFVNKKSKKQVLAKLGRGKEWVDGDCDRR